MSSLKRGIAVPCFAEDPMELARLGIEAERAGFDGFFLWDHIVFSNTGEGPPIVDPWLVLAVVAASTSTIKIGTMITPVPRRRPWQLAKETATLDRLSNGRLIIGVGIGSPTHGDFGLIGEPTEPRIRAELLDEGLDVMAGLWTGDWFSHEGKHFRLGPVKFSPAPVQQPRIPVWVGGVLPNPGPVARATRWDGMVPIRYSPGLSPATAQDMADIGAAAARARGTTDGFDLVVWSDVAADPAQVPVMAEPYVANGVTWWIESARPGDGWWQGAQARVAAGV